MGQHLNIETLNGLGTIHHTYGIVYQNISSAVAEVACIPTHRNSGRRFSKVSCIAKNDTIEPYYKKLKISEHEFTSGIPTTSVFLSVQYKKHFIDNWKVSFLR